MGWNTRFFSVLPTCNTRSPGWENPALLDGICKERCWSVINGHSTNTAGRTDREGREGGTWLDSRSCRRGFQGWLRAATRGLGNSREVQRAPLGRNPRKKLSLLFSKNTGNQWGMETKGNFESPCKMKHPIKWSSLEVTGNVFICTFAP